ncbi:malate synthase [Savagea faecisuis]|uniref:Malate synthase n=1 Tax=Savagea faecisuis TaxID=1274803 RepID=A0ABW3GUV3_9BACL
MNLIDETVTHKVFGEGQIVEQDEKTITVNFDEDVKKFVYPDAFKSFIMLQDRDLSERLEETLKKMRAEEARLEEKREKEFEQKMIQQQLRARLKNENVHESSQIVFWLNEEDDENIFEDWTVFTGTVQSGKKKGEPNRAARLRPNSMAVLTKRDAKEQEADRKIVGLFMVSETFIGSSNEDGFIPSHELFKIELTEEESEQMLFWNYYMNPRSPKRMAWNSGRYRYFDNVWGAQILRDVLNLRQDEEEQERLEAFFDYYCHLNLLDRETIPAANGSLLQQ